jgi:ADP-ribose pyrophosphatase YjhB (NUDIX family)
MSIGPETWGLFGGARERDEPPVTAALREAAEESTLDITTVRMRGLLHEDHRGWAYDTIVADVAERQHVEPRDWESKDARWVPADEVADMDLFPAFAASWPRGRAAMRRTVLVIDTANVMGSRNDGWWRDRHGAAVRLRDQVDGLDGLPLPPFDTAFPDLVMVVEGKAREVEDGERVRTVRADHDGDDKIVETVRELTAPGVDIQVVTADRELKRRCQAEGATLHGPRWLLDQL